MAILATLAGSRRTDDRGYTARPQGEADELAQAGPFLASNASSFVTGVKSARGRPHGAALTYSEEDEF